MSVNFNGVAIDDGCLADDGTAHMPVTIKTNLLFMSLCIRQGSALAYSRDRDLRDTFSSTSRNIWHVDSDLYQTHLFALHQQY